MKNVWIWIVALVLVVTGGALWWQGSKGSAQTYVDTPVVETQNMVQPVSASTPVPFA